ncbi:MAG TPA: hypothetical protein VLR26_00785 [Frankiaceae bacterium]|nr:hypothetical protein [Frankiaceae bacterium]
MEHVVFFSQSPGEPEFRRVGDLEEAVHLVERLRNERGISDVTLHALTPVPVSFRTYYRVEIGSTDGGPEVEVSALEAASSALVAAAEPVVTPAPVVTPEPVHAAEPVDDEEPVDFRSLSLLPRPVDGAGVFELDEPAEAEQFANDAPAFTDEVPGLAPVLAELPIQAEPSLLADPPPLADVTYELEGPADEFDSFASFDPAPEEPLVPQVRPEPAIERSLGYFAS